MNKRLLRWMIAGLITVALLVTGMIAAEHWMTSSATGTVQVGSTTSEVTQPAPKLVQVQASYFSTTLPASFAIKRQTETPNSTTTLLQLMAATPGTTDQQLGVTVGLLPTAGLSDLGDYHLRLTQTNTYARSTMTGLPSGSVAFHTVSGPVALTLFWPHTSQYAEIALSSDGGATLDQLQSSLTQTLKNWQWK